MKRQGPVLALLFFLFAVIVIGCGGSGGGSKVAATVTGGGSSTGTDGGGGEIGKGRLNVVLDWPAFTREIPDYAKSVVLTIKLPGATTPLASRVVDRSGNNAYGQTIEFTDIPALDVVLECKAMTEPAGKGAVAGSFSTGIKVVANGESSLLAAIDSDVSGVAISNAPTTLEVGKGLVLLAHGLNEQSQVLALPAEAMTWSVVSGGGYIELLSNGTLAAIAAGASVVKVTEVSSGESAEVPITIVPASTTTGGGSTGETTGGTTGETTGGTTGETTGGTTGETTGGTTGETTGGTTGGTTGSTTGGTTGGGGGGPNLTGAKFLHVTRDPVLPSALFVEDIASGTQDLVIAADDSRLEDVQSGSVLWIGKASMNADGTQIIFDRTIYTNTAEGSLKKQSQEVYSVSRTGANLKLITKGTSINLRAINNSGTKILLGNQLIDVASGASTSLPARLAISWSDDEQYVFSGVQPLFTKSEILTGNSVDVYEDHSDSVRPVMSPDGGKVLVLQRTVQDTVQTARLLMHSFGGGPAYELDDWGENDRSYNFTPDGKGLVKESAGTGGSLIYYLYDMSGNKTSLYSAPPSSGSSWYSVRYLWQPGYGTRINAGEASL